MGTKGNGISVNQPTPWSAPAERSGDGAFPRIPDYAKSESPTTSRASHPPVVHRKSLNHKGSRAWSCSVVGVGNGTTAPLQPPELTFWTGVAGYNYEGAHSIYRLVHPFRPLLAPGVARGDSSSNRMAGFPAIPPDRHHRRRRIRLDPRRVVSARALVRRTKSLAFMRPVFERDIPEFNGNPRRERAALYQQVRHLDKRIKFVEIFSGPMVLVPLLCLLMELLKHGYLPSFTLVLILYIAIGIPLSFSSRMVD